MNQEQKLLINLLRLKFNNNEDISGLNLSDEILENVALFSGKHSLAPMLADSLLSNNLLEDSELKDEFKEILLTSVFQYQLQNAELLKICKIFEENKVDHIALKGAYLRTLYPEPYLRTSCDIDILVKPEQLDFAVELLKNNAYTYGKKTAHDVSFHSENGVHIELHFDIIEKENTFLNVENILSDIWNYALHKDENSYGYVLTPEMFYFYHIAHMFKHFKIGGCGIRFFLDTWILNTKVEYDNDKKLELLERAGLIKFETCAKKLSDIWFGEGEYDQITTMLEQYVLRGGIYGNVENNIAMRQAKTGSKLLSLYKKIFLRYDTLKFIYPVLEKHKYLMPLCQVRRWIRLLFVKKERTRSFNHIHKNNNISEDLVSEAKFLSEYFNI